MSLLSTSPSHGAPKGTPVRSGWLELPQSRGDGNPATLTPLYLRLRPVKDQRFR